MLIAALLTIAKIWKQPKCPSVDEWIKTVIHLHNEILLSHLIKKGNLNFHNTRIGLESIMLSEISQLEKDKSYVILLTCGI